MYLGHVKVTSCAITDFVCTKTYQWRCVGTVEVNQNKQTATELFTIQPEAGAHSPQNPLKATHRDRELKDALRKLH